MQCHKAAKHVDEYRTGEMPSALLEEIRKHLSECPRCAGELAGIERLAATARRMKVPAPPTLVEAVLTGSRDRYGAVDTDLGRIWLAFNDRGITMVHPKARTAGEFVEAYGRRTHRTASEGEVPERIARLVRGIAGGKGVEGEVPVDLSALGSFERDVLMILRRIPRGEVRPYAWLAREAGRPGAVRAVGNAMARNPVPLILPCHRVVPSGGGTGNYAFGSDMKRLLLRKEGVSIEELDELARDGVRYVGCRTTGIFCFPTCRDARRMLPSNRVPLGGVAAATAAGFRACRHCRPA
jgi:O-6-methylguanine DNA methyltransferase